MAPELLTRVIICYNIFNSEKITTKNVVINDDSQEIVLTLCVRYNLYSSLFKTQLIVQLTAWSIVFLKS